MAGGGEENVTEIVINDEAHDFRSLLSSSERDFLVRNNGDQVLFDSVNFFFFIEWLLMGVFFFLTPLWLAKQIGGWWHVMWASWVYSSNKENWLMGILVIFSGKYGLWERKERRVYVGFDCWFYFLCKK